MNHKRTLALIFILALLLRLFFVFAIPVFQKPDENMHFEYIEFVAENKKLPVGGNFLSEFFQAPLYYITTSFILNSIKIFTENLWVQVMLMRLISVFLSMITLYIIYKIASLIFANKSLVLGILSFAAFLPSHLNVNSNVTNANLSQVFTALIIYMLILNLSKTSFRNNAIIGGLAGLALITRASSLPAVLTIPFAYAIKLFPRIKKAIKPLIVIGLIALIISSWVLIRNFMLYGDIFAYSAIQMSTPPDFMEKDLVFVAKVMIWTFATFWATFGRINNVFIGSIDSTAGISILFIFNFFLLIVTLCSAFGLIILYKKYKKNKKVLSSFQIKSFLILATQIILMLILFIKFNLYNFEPQGRLFFPAIAGFAVFFTLGIFTLFEKYKIKNFLTIYIAFFLLIDIISMARVIQFFY